MSKNVVLWNGKVVTLPDDQADEIDKGSQLGAHVETPVEGGEAARAARESSIHSTGFGKGIESVGDALSGGAMDVMFGRESGNQGREGFLDTLSFGGYGKAKDALSTDDDVYAARAERQAHGTARLAGSIGALVVNPGNVLGEAGLAAKGAEAIGLGTGTARLAEGAALGAGAHIADSNVTGDPVTIEGTLQSAGLGAVLNYAAGAVTDRLIGGSEKAQKAIQEAGATKTKVEFANKGRELLSEPPPSWQEAHDAFNAYTEAANKQASAAAKERAAVQDWLDSPGKRASTISDFEGAQKELSARYQQAYKENAALANNYGKWTAGPDKINAALRKIDTAAERVYADAQDAGLEAWKAGGNPETAFGEHGPLLKALRGAEDVKRMVAEGDYTSATEALRGITQDARAASGAAKLGDIELADIPPAPGSPQRGQSELQGLAEDQPEGIDAVSQRYTDAISDIRRTTERARLAGRLGKPQEALDHLRGLADRLDPNKLDVELPNVPTLSTPGVDVPTVKLGKTLEDFARQHPDTISRFSNEMDDTTRTAFQKLAGDIGISADDGAAGVHRRVNAFLKVGDEVTTAEKAAKAAAKTEAKPGFLGWLGDRFKSAVKYAAARAGDVGGPVGALTRMAAGEAAGKVMNGVEDAYLGSTLIAGKQGLRGALETTIAKYGAAGGKVVQELAPVTTYLSQSFPSGTPDNERDIRKRAAARMQEIQAAAQTTPNNSYLAMQDLMGHPGDLAFKFHQQIVNAVNHLASTLPVDPGLDRRMFQSDWLPSHAQAIELAHRLEAVIDPISSIIRTISGQGHPAGAQTLNTVWPATVKELANQVSYAEPKIGNIGHLATAGYSQLFQVPLSGLQTPEVLATLQGQYLPRAPQAGPGGGPRASGGGGVGGRPPAVNSKVAGSSVTNLIS